MAKMTAKRASPRERLLAASDELFYRNGVHSTGIDAVIERAGVAKGSLYYIFGGKDELVAAYLRGRLDAWHERVDAAQAGIDDPEEKILAVFDAIADYVSLPEFRGCPFDYPNRVKCSQLDPGPTLEKTAVPAEGHEWPLRDINGHSPKSAPCPLYPNSGHTYFPVITVAACRDRAFPLRSKDSFLRSRRIRRSFSAPARRSSCR